MKRIINILIVFVLIINLLACRNINSTTELSTSQIPTDINKFEDCTQEEIEQARKDVEIIIQALNNKDTDRIKSVLTNFALQETKDLDMEIKYLFDMLDGEIVEAKEYSINSCEDWAYHEKRCVIYLDYDIFTKNQKYILRVFYLPRNDTELDNVGVFSFRLLDCEMDHEYELFYFTPDVVPGVFSSDKQTIENNIEKLMTIYNEFPYIEVYGKPLAFILDCVGVESIKEMTFELTEWEGLKLTLIDSQDNKYYVVTGEYGTCPKVRENDENGKLLYYEYDEIIAED